MTLEIVIVDENLENYLEMHGWLTGIGFPRDREQYTKMLKANTDSFTMIGKESTALPGKVVSGAYCYGTMFFRRNIKHTN